MWFRVDDDFYKHPKWIGVRDATVSLWVRSGAWCAHYLTDGRIPSDVLASLGCRRRVIAQSADELVERGLWVPDGDTFVFHDWNDYQPTKAGVLVRRAADLDRRKRYLARINESGRATTHEPGNGVTGDVTDAVTDDVTGDVTHASGNGVTARASHDVPDPARRDGSVVQVDQSPPDRNARDPEPGERDPIEDVNDVVAAAIRTRTGRELTADQANALRIALTEGRTVTHPAMYLQRVIASHPDPGSLVPAAEPPAGRRKRATGPPPVGEVLAKANDPEGRGRKPRASDESRAAIAAQAREALAAKGHARRDAAAQDADAEQPDPELADDYAVQPGDDDPQYPPEPPGQDHDTELF